MTLTLYNTLSRAKETFAPCDPAAVRMFVCGPTVYDLPHVGHAKTYTQFDFVARYLRHRGFDVTYVQNITDVDDKIIARAAESGVSASALADRFEGEYRADMDALHNTSVNVYARAHDYIETIVDQVAQLASRGHAYRLDDGWYYDLSTFPDYGKLSRRTHVRPGDSVARIDETAGKRHAGDFALWKFRKSGEPYWTSPLGEGRPGWHIEDTAITQEFFGPQYDLHGGATDLIFPHHEAEIAQMEGATGKVPFVRYWMHTGLLNAGQAKMAKSAGNVLTIRQALERASFRTLRYAFISQHYRSSMLLTDMALQNARDARRRVENFARSTTESDNERGVQRAERARIAFFERLDDDFDTPGALATLFSYIREQNKAADDAGPSARRFLADVDSLFDAFRLGTAPSADPVIQQLIEERAELRRRRLFAEADLLRLQLDDLGVVVEDTGTGTGWRYRESSTPRSSGSA